MHYSMENLKTGDISILYGYCWVETNEWLVFKKTHSSGKHHQKVRISRILAPKKSLKFQNQRIFGGRGDLVLEKSKKI